ncbi:MAG: alpha/beta fold hydrolase [Ramlibacter sp.]|nr:alpha/beta fold hydrolase [Ramlibacter sp.]
MAKLNYVSKGRGPTLVLSHALGSDLHMWNEVASQLEAGFHVVRYDHPGHGQSPAIGGRYTVEQMADGAAELIASLDHDEVHFIGLSLGGMVAQQIAVRHPQLVSSIVVANSASAFDEVARGMWRARIETVLNLGMPAIADATIKRWFAAEFRQHPERMDRIAQLRAVLEATDARAYAACCEAMSRADLAGSNPRIACPALVVAGALDESTTPAMAEAIWNSISGAELASLDTGHFSAVERPYDFAGLVASFINRVNA